MPLNMSDREQLEKRGSNPEAEEPPSQGPSLVLLYSLIGIALLAAIFIAGLIVLPFYQHRH